jgi:hypothetical protein
MACGRKPRPRRKVAKAMKKGNFKRIIVGLGVENVAPSGKSERSAAKVRSMRKVLINI